MVDLEDARARGRAVGVGVRDEQAAAMAGFVLPVAAERGEPWLTFHTPEGITALLEHHGLRAVEHVREPDIPAVAARSAPAPASVDLCRLVVAAPYAGRERPFSSR